MTQEQELVIIEPDGAQGKKLGINLSSQEQLVKFDEAVGQLPKAKRKNIRELSRIAHKLGIDVVKP